MESILQSFTIGGIERVCVNFVRRYLIKDKPEGEFFVIKGDKLHHIFNVCRHSLGSKFEIISPQISYLVQVVEVDKHKAVCKILSSTTRPELKKPYLHLYISMPKLSIFEFVLEKCVELGVKSITPMFSQFSDIRNPNRISSKLNRWKKIVESATEQSNRSDLMAINQAGFLSEIVKSKVGFFADASFERFDAALEENHDDISLFVGSEGGFSDKERKEFITSGIKGVGLGDNILRVETACIAFVSVCRYRLKI